MRSPQEFSTWLAARGAAHTSAARAAGFTVHAMRSAMAVGDAERLRRSWLVAPSCDPDLRRAAAEGARLTCLSAARRRGLWTPDHEGLHVAVAPTASRFDTTGLHVHWSTGPAPVARAALEDEIINILFHVARCAAPPDALAVWESAIRARHVDPDVLARVAWRSEPARRLAAVASQLSDSGVETRFMDLMRGIGVTVRQQVLIDGHRLDGLIGERLGIQIDGFAYHQAADRRRDLRQDTRLVLRGYTILRFDYYQVLFDPAYVIATVTAAIAQGLHRAPAVAVR
ncbi:endonuclease domain-containing protein [Microbacterium luticocti]|uniref:endonuclease domain-containing protein n=1 Tax=Microbacterium luticocti TaxID=451764 RepID=UPI00041B3391|nr:DUF559 domain-containing protein [Microbacterium luticocti]